MRASPALAPTPGSYRPEIDGLRAIAVFAVILFHARVPGFEGGFLGVDIFFVISGYLITGLICRDLAAGQFSLRHFYERRIRRILPALNVTMLLCILPAWYLMLPDDLENVGQSLIATSVFANNVLLYLTADYFGLAAEFKPLVHSWSLGVEEQYYLAIPLVLWLSFRLGRRMPALTLTIATALSFAFCLYTSAQAPIANFYLPFSRVWMLGIGGLVAMAEPGLRPHALARPALADSLADVGLILTLAPFVLVTDGTGMPDARTLLPVAGVSLLLICGRAGGVAGRLLVWRPLVGIGLISFSLYLYHQPVFAFVRIARLEEPSPWLLLAFVPVIAGLAYLSWRWVEQPFRDRRRPFARVVIMVGATTMVAIGAGASFHLTSGFSQHWPELAVGDTGYGARENAEYAASSRSARKTGLPAQSDRRRLLVAGDSFAGDFFHMGEENGWLAQQVVGRTTEGLCAPPTRYLIDNAPRADLIVLAFKFGAGEVDCVAALRDRLRPLTRARILILGPKNFGWNNNAVMRLPEAERYGYRAVPLASTIAANDAGRARFGNDYVDLLAMIADADGRVPVFTPDSKFISQDRWHVTQAGAAHIGAILLRHPAFASTAGPR